MVTASERPVMQEEQRFTNPVILILTAFCSLYSIYAGAAQLFFRSPVNNDPVPSWAAWLLLLFGILLGWTILSARLVTEIRQDGIYVRYYPFHRTFRRFGFDTIIDVTAVTYRPVLDYGGWGIRHSLTKGKAYNVKGNRGILLTFNEGGPLLIGSQIPERLMESVNALRDSR